MHQSVSLHVCMIANMPVLCVHRYVLSRQTCINVYVCMYACMCVCISNTGSMYVCMYTYMCCRMNDT